MTKNEIDGALWTFRLGIYRHYKGGLYRALSLVAHHETRQPWVLYVSLERGSVNIRPLQGHHGDRDGWEDHVRGEDGLRVPRFLLVDATLDGIDPAKKDPLP